MWPSGAAAAAAAASPLSSNTLSGASLDAPTTCYIGKNRNTLITDIKDAVREQEPGPEYDSEPEKMYSNDALPYGIKDK